MGLTEVSGGAKNRLTSSRRTVLLGSMMIPLEAAACGYPTKASASSGGTGDVSLLLYQLGATTVLTGKLPGQTFEAIASVQRGTSPTIGGESLAGGVRTE